MQWLRGDVKKTKGKEVCVCVGGGRNEGVDTAGASMVAHRSNNSKKTVP
jgi:hypothetical protein